MKIKILTLFLSLTVIFLTIVACVKLPLEETSKDPLSRQEENSNTSNISDPGDSSEPDTGDSSEDGTTTYPADSSEEDQSTDDSSEESSGEESSGEESSGEESNPVEIILPYPNVKDVTVSSLTASEYDAYFADSMFIGNSVMYHFSLFYSQMKYKMPTFLGGANFFAASSYSALNDRQEITTTSPHPKYKQVKMRGADAVKESEVKRVYVSLMALNELALYNLNTCVDDTFKSMVKYINDIKQKSPNVEIVVLSNTYMVYNFNGMARLNNGNISALNNKMLDYCNQNGIDFIDLSTFLMEGNVLADKYCTDYEKKDGNNGCHLTNQAYAMWTAALRNYAYLKQAGAWKNPTSMPTYTKNQ